MFMDNTLAFQAAGLAASEDLLETFKEWKTPLGAIVSHSSKKLRIYTFVFPFFWLELKKLEVQLFK